MRNVDTEMPNWTAPAGIFIAFHLLLIATSGVALHYCIPWYNELGELYTNLQAPAFEFATSVALTSFTTTFLASSVLGVLVGGIALDLDSSREDRRKAKRLPSDTALDVAVGFHIFLLACCMVAAGLVAGFLTFVYATTQLMPPACPGDFENPDADPTRNDFWDGEALPTAECPFDLMMQRLVYIAVGSNQIAQMWSDIQLELGCCGYWCPQGNDSWVSESSARPFVPPCFLLACVRSCVRCGTHSRESTAD
jgi:hypothetical protein